MFFTKQSCLGNLWFEADDFRMSWLCYLVSFRCPWLPHQSHHSPASQVARHTSVRNVLWDFGLRCLETIAESAYSSCQYIPHQPVPFYQAPTLAQNLQFLDFMVQVVSSIILQKKTYSILKQKTCCKKTYSTYFEKKKKNMVQFLAKITWPANLLADIDAIQSQEAVGSARAPESPLSGDPLGSMSKTAPVLIPVLKRRRCFLMMYVEWRQHIWIYVYINIYST